ncbi:MAG: hypothetical protein K0R80_1506 [Clostridia bacterium]|jgi:hypothetical protein|nr:hypothetical protein [Clostridia bacterium]
MKSILRLIFIFLVVVMVLAVIFYMIGFVLQ